MQISRIVRTALQQLACLARRPRPGASAGEGSQPRRSASRSHRPADPGTSTTRPIRDGASRSSPAWALRLVAPIGEGRAQRCASPCRPVGTHGGPLRRRRAHGKAVPFRPGFIRGVLGQAGSKAHGRGVARQRPVWLSRLRRARGLRLSRRSPRHVVRRLPALPPRLRAGGGEKRPAHRVSGCRRRIGSRETPRT